MDHSAIESVTGERIGVPAHLLRGNPGDHYVLRVVGDSMIEEGIFDGDYAICQRVDPLPGDVCIVLLGDDASIKRYYLEGDTVRLQSLIQKLPPIRVAASKCIVHGVVVGLMRKFERGTNSGTVIQVLCNYQARREDRCRSFSTKTSR